MSASTAASSAGWKLFPPLFGPARTVIGLRSTSPESSNALKFCSLSVLIIFFAPVFPELLQIDIDLGQNRTLSIATLNHPRRLVPSFPKTALPKRWPIGQRRRCALLPCADRSGLIFKGFYFEAIDHFSPAAWYSSSPLNRKNWAKNPNPPLLLVANLCPSSLHPSQPALSRLTDSSRALAACPRNNDLNDNRLSQS